MNSRAVTLQDRSSEPGVDASDGVSTETSLLDFAKSSALGTRACPAATKFAMTSGLACNSVSRPAGDLAHAHSAVARNCAETPVCVMSSSLVESSD